MEKSKEAKEAEINAKIAAIRAKNAERERRHAEVEADRKRAEQSKSTIQFSKQVSEGGAGPPFAHFHHHDTPASGTKRSVKSRLGTPAAACAPGVTNVTATNATVAGSKRLSDKDLPPPDPGYNFLADRMREESDQEDSAAPAVPKSKCRPVQRERRGGFQSRKAAVETPARQKVNLAQSRLEKTQTDARSPPVKEREEEKEVSSESWTCPDPNCQKRNAENTGSCGQCHLPWSKAQTFRKKATSAPLPAPPPSQPPPENNWQAMPPVVQPQPVHGWQTGNEWQQPVPGLEPAQDWGQTHGWREGSAGSDWAEEVMNEIPDPAVPAGGVHWVGGPGQSAYLYPDQPLQVLPSGYPPQDAFVPIPPLHQVSPQQVHNVAAALTQMSHGVPIMATHSSPTVHAYSTPPPTTVPAPAPLPRYQYYQPPPPGSGYSNGDYNHRRPSRDFNGRPPRHSYRPPEREITKIPSRFQKQKPTSQAPNTYCQRKALLERDLPKAVSTEPPASCQRLTVFGTSNVVNNLTESDLSNDLGISVRLIPTMKLESFRKEIGQVDPKVDRFVLIHCLGNDARGIALLSSAKTDVDKGAESDEIASEFAEIIKDLVDRIPYVQVFISTLLPRFDAEDQAGMSCPNNVRKVMNVEISTRLNDAPNVTFINNDLVLEWWKDDVKKMRLFGSDGYHLTAYGFSVMLDQWMKVLKQAVKEADVHSSPETEEIEKEVSELSVH